MFHSRKLFTQIVFLNISSYSPSCIDRSFIGLHNMRCISYRSNAHTYLIMIGFHYLLHPIQLFHLHEDACPRMQSVSSGLSTVGQCKATCEQEGKTLAVPYSREEYNCFHRKGNVDQTAMWTGMVENANGIYDRYSGVQVPVFQTGTVRSRNTGRHNIAYWQSTISTNAIFLQISFYVATSTSSNSQDFTCGCERRKRTFQALMLVR